MELQLVVPNQVTGSYSITVSEQKTQIEWRGLPEGVPWGRLTLVVAAQGRAVSSAPLQSLSTEDLGWGGQNDCNPGQVHPLSLR